MTDSPQNQPSLWIGNEVCVKESNNGTQYFGDIKTNVKWCGNELDKSLVANVRIIDDERCFMFKDQLQTFVPKIEDTHFSYDLSTENTSNNEIADFCSDTHVKLNETFNIGAERSSQIEFGDYQILEAINDQTINHPTIKSVCFPEKSAFFQLDAEKLKVFDKTINLSVFEPEYVSEKVTRFDSEESLGIIPEVLENSWELFGSCSDILNKEKYCSPEVDHEVSEVFSLPSLNCHDLKNQCFEYINRHLESNSSGSNYTSTPKAPKNYSDSDYLQDKFGFSLNEGVKVDEPIIAGSSQTVSEILDAEEFDYDKILTSTSKLSSLLQIHNSDSLNKTAILDCKNFSFTCKEVNGVFNYNLTKASTETLEINAEYKDLKAFSSLHNTDINTTFEVKPESPQMFPLGNYLDASPILHEKCNLNKTITVDNLNNTSGMYNDEVMNSNSLDLNLTQTLKSSDELNGLCINATYSEITENQTSFNMQLNECSVPATEVNSLCRTLTKATTYSSTENISLPINNSNSSFKIATKATSLTSKINTCKKNGELQTKQSVLDRFNKRHSLSAYPTLQKTNSLKLNPLTKSLPVSLKADYLHSSRQSLSNLKSKGSVHELPKKFTKTASTTCLSKPVKADTFNKFKNGNMCRRSNSLGLQGKAVQSKEFKYDEACLKSKVGFQDKAVVKTSLNGSTVTNDISKRLSLQKKTFRSDHGLLKSYTKGNEYSKGENQTFSISNEIYDKGNTTVRQKMSETASKISGNGHAVQIKESPTVSKFANKNGLKSKTVIQAKAVMKSPLDSPFVKKDFSNNFRSRKISYDVSLKPPTKTNNHLKDKKQRFTASDDFYVSKNTTFNMQERSEIESDISSQHINDPTVQTEKLATQNSATEFVNLTKTESDNSVADVLNRNVIDLSNDSSDKSLIDISEKSTDENKSVNSNIPLKCHLKGTFPKPVGKPKLFIPTRKCSFSSNISENKDSCKNKHIAKGLKGPFEISSMSKNDLTRQIKESPTDNSVTDVLTETFIDMHNDTCSKSSKNILTNECKNLNSNVSVKRCAKGIFSKPVSKQRLSFKPTLKSQDVSNLCKSKGEYKNEKIESVKDSSEISSKIKNDHTIQIEELPTDSSVANIVNLTVTKSEDSVTNVLSKTFTDMPNDSHGESFKDILVKSAEESSNINTKVSLKCRVKGIFSKPVNKQRLSFLPTVKSKVLRESKDECKEKNIENELPGPSSISTKQCGKGIQIPRFHLKTSSRHVKEAVGLERKPSQKENIESNFPSMGMKNSNLKSYQSGNGGKFCHTGSVLKPQARNASNVLPAPMLKKESSNSVKLKPVHRILSSVARQQSLPTLKTKVPSSQRIR